MKNASCLSVLETFFQITSNASGFGTVSYLRLLDGKQKVHCAFVIGKARLNPITIPRLELTAFSMAVRMNEVLKAELEIPLEPSVYWTDSTSALKYLRNETSGFHTFVANRVASIHAVSDVTQWRHVGSTQPCGLCIKGFISDAFLPV